MDKIKNRWLIAASAVGVQLSIGAVYAYSVFKQPLYEAVGWEQSQTAWAFSLAILVLGLSAAFLGPKVEQMGPRKSGVIAACCYSAGLLLSGLAVALGNVYLFYLGYGVISGVGLGIGYISPVSSLVKWFPERRGLATGLAIMGFGFGALLASQVIQLLIERAGIPTTFVTLGVAYFVIMFVSAQYIEAPPAGWVPEAMKAEREIERLRSKPPKQRPSDLASLDSMEALKTQRFYYLWLMFFLNTTCGIALISVASPLSQELAGFTPVAAASMVGWMGLFNGLGRIGWASLSDLIGRPLTYTTFFVAQLAAFYFLPRTDSPVVFQGLVFLILSCYGGGFSSMPAYIGDLFGTKSLSAILGKMLTAWAVAGLVGPQLAAYVRETTGSYEQTLSIFAGLFVAALLVSLLIQMNIIKLRNSNAAVASV